MNRMDALGNIEICCGDPLNMRRIIHGPLFDGLDAAWFGIRKPNGKQVLKLEALFTPLAGSCVVDVRLTGGMTKKIGPGEYEWDIRTTSRGETVTYYNVPRKLRIMEVAVDV